MRYERKYRIEELSLEAVHQRLMMHPAGFKEHFPERRVQSIYFDDTRFELAQATLAGVSDRCKYRIRWYGDNDTTAAHPVLETKIKSNMLGYKDSTTLPNLDLQSSLRHYCEQNIPQELALFPTVYVSYQRRYLLSFDHKVRVTVDRSIQYKSIDNYSLSKALIKDHALVVEFKYEQEHARVAEDMMASFPFRVGKNSKYVNAVQGFWL